MNMHVSIVAQIQNQRKHLTHPKQKLRFGQFGYYLEKNIHANLGIWLEI